MVRSLAVFAGNATESGLFELPCMSVIPSTVKNYKYKLSMFLYCNSPYFAVALSFIDTAATMRDMFES